MAFPPLAAKAACAQILDASGVNPELINISG
jgi:hypothetical protein